MRQHVQAAAPAQFQPDRTLVTAFAEPSIDGRSIWVVWRDRKGVLHEQQILEEDQTITMKALYGVVSAVHNSMSREVIRACKEYTR
jgi:hypothetical protein